VIVVREREYASRVFVRELPRFENSRNVEVIAGYRYPIGVATRVSITASKLRFCPAESEVIGISPKSERIGSA
jgi:hypothetical protein